MLSRLVFLLCLSFSNGVNCCSVCFTLPALPPNPLLSLQHIGRSRKARRKLRSKRRRTKTKKQIQKSKTRTGTRTMMKMRKGWKKKNRMKKRK
jgi:hypothetical protein